MDALELLTTRSSMPRLVAPGPSAAQFAVMQQAAGRAPDHMELMPYRFVVFTDAGLTRLADIFVAAAQARGDDALQLERVGQLPLRAPMVIACLMDYQAHDKVPSDEQFASAACATLMMQQAAFAQGLGAIWRTGWLAEDASVLAALGGKPTDKIVGFLYVGTPAVSTPIKPAKAIGDKFTDG